MNIYHISLPILLVFPKVDSCQCPIVPVAIAFGAVFFVVISVTFGLVWYVNGLHKKIHPLEATTESGSSIQSNSRLVFVYCREGIHSLIVSQK